MTRLAVIILALLLSYPAGARWKPEYTQLPQSVKDWYQNAELTEAARKRFNFIKCCAQADTVQTRFKVNKTTGRDEWWYINHNGSWEQIPDDIIHWGQSGPEGKPVLFVITNRPVCFFPPESGI